MSKGLSRCLPSERRISRWAFLNATIWLQSCFGCYETAVLVGYLLSDLFLFPAYATSADFPYVLWQQNSSIVRYVTKGTSVTRSPVMTKTGWLKCQWCGKNPLPDDSPLLGSRGRIWETYIILTQTSLFKPACDGELEEMPALVTSASSTEPSAQSAVVKQEEKDDWSPFLSALAAHEQEVCPWTKKNPRRSLLNAAVRREVRSPCVWS